MSSTVPMKKAELVFIPPPVPGHLVSTVEAAKILVDRDDRLFITVLIMPPVFESNINKQRTASLVASLTTSRLRFINLPMEEHDPNATPVHGFTYFLEAQKRHVKEVVSKLISQSESTPESPRLVGFVLDMFCTTMVDVADEFGVPSYIFYTSAAAFLGFVFFIQNLHAEQKLDITEFKDSDAELAVPSLEALLPARVLPASVLKKDVLSAFFLNARLRESKGIMVNTFVELESHPLSSLSDGKTPPIYPVGPVLNLKGGSNGEEGADGSSKYKEIMDWLDDQPHSSVVFLCFGSMGSFDADQVKEIGSALEHSGHRFLWSLRKPPPKGKMESPGEYLNPQEVLPEGFLDRTAGIGKVIGWAPQVAILAHPAVGGFVSHCGWNSALESLWFGVPIAAWPIYAEQQFNAFLLVTELGLAAEIKMDYRKDFTAGSQDSVGAEEIERGIRCVMEPESELRKRVKEMSDRSRKAVMDGGSSHCSIGRLIQDVIDSMP